MLGGLSHEIIIEDPNEPITKRRAILHSVIGPNVKLTVTKGIPDHLFFDPNKARQEVGSTYYFAGIPIIIPDFSRLSELGREWLKMRDNAKLASEAKRKYLEELLKQQKEAKERAEQEAKKNHQQPDGQKPSGQKPEPEKKPKPEEQQKQQSESQKDQPGQKDKSGEQQQPEKTEKKQPGAQEEAQPDKAEEDDELHVMDEEPEQPEPPKKQPPKKLSKAKSKPHKAPKTKSAPQQKKPAPQEPKQEEGPIPTVMPHSTWVDDVEWAFVFEVGLVLVDAAWQSRGGPPLSETLQKLVETIKPLLESIRKNKTVEKLGQLWDKLKSAGPELKEFLANKSAAFRQYASSFRNAAPREGFVQLGNGAKDATRGIIKEFTEKAFKLDHIFSDDHVNRGIRNLGLTDDALIKKFEIIVREVDLRGAFKEGFNAIHATINGVKVELRPYIQNGKVLNVDGFVGWSPRNINNAIHYP